MTQLRSFLLKLMPKSLRDDAERQSRLWLTECASCGNVSNIWELGGMRWRAYGNPTAGMRGLGCGKVATQRIRKSGLRSF